MKAECLRLLATLKLDREKMELISGFIDTYLRLSEEEEEQFRQALERMELQEKECMMQIVTSWQEKGREEGLQEGLQQGQIRKGQEDIIRILEFRFEDVSLELRELAKRIDDLEVLGELLLQAVATPSLEEFESVVNQLVSEEESDS
ncbi:MAG TPA: hypothetical protein DCE56_34395 [Cyanobacteria bacterium UBA8553]|nr:hypothetical protein [Cyanobacteria bacterium UBA8553]